MSIFPVNPLTHNLGADDEYRRRTISGILESYNGSYDALAEAVQNAVDALEDAALQLKPDGPYELTITINLKENWFSVLDTGTGMSPTQVASAFAPSVSFKHEKDKVKRRAKAPYRGYKGVGLTFLAYGSDDIALHSKKSGELVKGRMEYGRAWADGRRPAAAQIVEDETSSPLEKLSRGTYVKVQLSQHTRPKSLLRLASTLDAWKTVLRTRTAIGQVLLGREPVVKIDTKLVLVASDGKEGHAEVIPTFLLPHLVSRKPPFRFLDLLQYHADHPEQTAPPSSQLRQDGIYLTWDVTRIKKQLTQDQRETFADELTNYTPSVYAFTPYQGSVWGDLNSLAVGAKNREHLQSGLIIATNRQRVADVFEIKATRFESFSRNVQVVVHFDNAKPDQGRKTLQDDVLRLAEKIADRVVQYLATQRSLLRPAGEAPTPEQRNVEKGHEDWIFNVRKHAEVAPIHAPPLSLCSTPLTEQDVVGLFHQLSAVGLFPGIKIFATSQIKTYDCLISFEADAGTAGLLYTSSNETPFGISPYIKGDVAKFTTRNLTVEFKNNLDALIDDIDGESQKTYRKIDVAVCWSTVDNSFSGYALEEIDEQSIDERQFPGVTHLLRKDGESHVVQVVMLATLLDAVKAGRVTLPI